MKSEVFATFCSILVVVTLLKANAEPGGSILLHLNSLENKNYASGCCSGCAAQCNYQLEIWATCDTNKKNNSDCLYGYSKTGIFSNTSSIIFGESLGNGLWNPLAFDFSFFYNGTLGFQILVRNQSGLQIDEYIYHVVFYPESYDIIKSESISLTATGSSDSRLNLTYSVFCNKHYYGPSCVVGCIPGKTYVCDKATESEICNEGGEEPKWGVPKWAGSGCDCMIEMFQYGCNNTTGKKFCYLPWYGENCDVKCEAKNDNSSGYSCDSTTGAKMCLNGWYGNECNLSSSSPLGPNVTSIVIVIEPHSTSRKTSSEGPLGASVNIEGHTVRPEVVPATIESNSSLLHRIRETSSIVGTKEIEPGSSKASKKQDIWCMVLLPFALVALLVAAALVILKKRGRKRGKIS